MQLSFDPSGTRVVLIGSTTCAADPENLPPLPAVKENIDALRRLFKSTDIIGLEDGCVESILDPRNSPEVLTRLDKIAKQATDTLLIYYAGHGIKSAAERGLFLATVDTTQEQCHLNGVEFKKIQQIIYNSPAAKKILILDSCYSGEALAGEMGGGAQSVIADSIRIRGTYSIASAPRNRISYASPDEQYTSFTGEFIRVLENGIKENTEYLTLDRIYEELKNRIARNPNLPEPQRTVEFDADAFVFAKNSAWASDPEVRIRKLEERYKAQLAEVMAENDRKQAAMQQRISELESRPARTPAVGAQDESHAARASSATPLVSQSTGKEGPPWGRREGWWYSHRKLVIAGAVVFVGLLLLAVLGRI
jgi:uncharacterized caspase-like protein